MAGRTAVVSWLLEGDPSVRWQVMRDLTHEPEEVVAPERARVAEEGWGARLLARQTPDGHWSDEQQHGWMTTTDALQLLRNLGADPACEKVGKAIDRVRERITWYQLDGRPFFDGETEACINGRILATGAYFGAPVEPLLKRLLGEQLEDGGWNCEAPKSKRSSFHSTICVLEGLLEYEKVHGATTRVTDARARAENYLLERGMMKSLSTGEVINHGWTSFSFPAVWCYDVLRGLDYLRSAGVKPDDRVAEAVAVVERRRDADGRWPLDVIHRDHAERLAFDVETEVGNASRWNTLRALRVLDWYGK
jgi:hypothetical protein